MPVVNMGLHARLGLKFMLDDIEDELGDGDLLVVTPEYFQLTGLFYGGRELAALLIDVYPEGRQHLDWQHGAALAPYVPMHASSKLLHARWTQTGLQAVYESPGLYQRSSFNDHGDVVAHWTEQPRPFSPAGRNGRTPPDRIAIAYLREFRDRLRQRGAQMIMLPPALQKTSYANLAPRIAQISTALADAGIPFVASPERYRVDDALCFDSPYHLTKQGVDRRTALIIEDLRRLLADSDR